VDRRRCRAGRQRRCTRAPSRATCRRAARAVRGRATCGSTPSRSARASRWRRWRNDQDDAAPTPRGYWPGSVGASCLGLGALARGLLYVRGRSWLPGGRRTRSRLFHEGDRLRPPPGGPAGVCRSAAPASVACSRPSAGRKLPRRAAGGLGPPLCDAVVVWEHDRWLGAGGALRRLAAPMLARSDGAKRRRSAARPVAALPSRVGRRVLPTIPPRPRAPGRRGPAAAQRRARCGRWRADGGSWRARARWWTS
jgi:hypothetical protein